MDEITGSEIDYGQRLDSVLTSLIAKVDNVKEEEVTYEYVLSQWDKKNYPKNKRIVFYFDGALVSLSIETLEKIIDCFLENF